MCRRWGGYTLSSALEEDATLAYQTLALVDLYERNRPKEKPRGE